MSIYWLLLGLTAIIAYLFGSMDTMVLASNFIFRRNLLRLGDHSSWLSNFRRLFGIKGFFKLFVVEIIKDAIPIVIGSLLLGIRGHADVGAAFAGFRGSHATVAMIAAGFAAGTSVGAAAMIAAVGVIAVTRYLSLGTVAGAVVLVMVSVLAVDDSLILRLALFTAALVLVKHVPAMIRLMRRTEPRLSLEKDITYKLDE